jgi:hypothetical protein
MTTNLEKQLETTRQTWAKMQADGTSEDTPITIALHWHTEKADHAQDLAAQLVEQHQLSADAQRRGDEWVVLASIGPKKFTLPALEKTVQEMHAIGKAHSCVMDGWHPVAAEKDPA